MTPRPVVLRTQEPGASQSGGRRAASGVPASAGARDGGFTLIEIMVALAVFSLAVLALLRLETATIRGATTLDDSLIAGLVARNVANDAVTEAQPPVAGRTTGSEVNGGRSWNWIRNVRGTGNASIVRIDVAVTNAAGQVVGKTTAIRPADTPL
jgi:general secretion pathway protein I